MVWSSAFRIGTMGQGLARAALCLWVHAAGGSSSIGRPSADLQEGAGLTAWPGILPWQGLLAPCCLPCALESTLPRP